MSKIFAVIQKELRLYWNSPIAYIFIVSFLVISFWFFFRGFFITGQAEMRYFFSLLPWIFLFLIPALTMRLWSEEYRQGTIETLLTSSLSYWQVIGGKFLATLFFLLITLLATLSLPISISFIGSLDVGTVFVGYVGAFLLGALYIALGLFISAMSNNQIVSFIMTVIFCFVIFIIGEPIVTFSLPGFIAPVFQFISAGAHYSSMVRGIIDTQDVVYFISLIGLLLYCNLHVLQSRK